MASPTVIAAASSNGMDQNPFGSVNMDDFFNDIYSDNAADELAPGNTTVPGREPEMTLEDFLTKAGAVAPDDVAITASAHPSPQFQGYGVGKRRASEKLVVDNVTQQRQKRMIKNRESAARSRERKQAYNVELEALVMQLEEENARLVREEGERSNKRFKKLMENLIPVGEKQRPPLRAHRRAQSMG